MVVRFLKLTIVGCVIASSRKVFTVSHDKCDNRSCCKYQQLYRLVIESVFEFSRILSRNLLYPKVISRRSPKRRECRVQRGDVATKTLISLPIIELL